METLVLLPPTFHPGHIKPFVDALMERYNAVRVIFFTQYNGRNQKYGYMPSQRKPPGQQYFMLVVTEGVKDIGFDLQKYMNTEISGPEVYVLDHGTQSVIEELEAHPHPYSITLDTGRMSYDGHGNFVRSGPRRTTS